MATRRKKSRARKSPKRRRKMSAAERTRRSRAAKKSIRNRRRRADGTLMKGRAHKRKRTRKSTRRRAVKSTAKRRPSRHRRAKTPHGPLGGLRGVKSKRGKKALKESLGTGSHKRGGKRSTKGSLVATAAEQRAGKSIPPVPAGYLRFVAGNGDLRQTKMNRKGGTKGRRVCR